MEFNKTLHKKIQTGALASALAFSGAMEVAPAHSQETPESTPQELVVPTTELGVCTIPDQLITNEEGVFTVNEHVVGGPVKINGERLWTTAFSSQGEMLFDTFEFDTTGVLQEGERGFSMQVPEGMTANVTVDNLGTEQNYFVMGGNNAEICGDFAVTKMTLFTQPISYDHNKAGHWLQLDQHKPITNWTSMHGTEMPSDDENNENQDQSSDQNATIEALPVPSSDTTSDGTQGSDYTPNTQPNNPTENNPDSQGGSSCDFSQINVPLTNTENPNVKKYEGDAANAQEFFVPDNFNVEFYDGEKMVTGYGPGEAKSSTATFYCDFTEQGMDLPDEWIDPGEVTTPTSGQPSEPEALSCKFDEIGVPLTDTDNPTIKVYNGDPTNAQVFNVPDGINAQFYDGTQMRTGHDGQGKSSNATFYCDATESGEDLPDNWEAELATSTPPSEEPTQSVETPEATDPNSCYESVGGPVEVTPINDGTGGVSYSGEVRTFNVPSGCTATYWNGEQQVIANGPTTIETSAASFYPGYAEETAPQENEEVIVEEPTQPASTATSEPITETVVPTETPVIEEETATEVESTPKATPTATLETTDEEQEDPEEEQEEELLPTPTTVPVATPTN